MKQRLTKMCALILVLVMFLSMAMPALAAESSDPNLKANTPYTVVCAANNLNVNVYVWKTADIKNNVAVNLYEATHDATQQFVFTKKNGAYLMQPYKATGYTVNISTAKAKAGSKLITYKKAAANDEYWIIEKKGAGYTFRMKSAPSFYITASGKTLQLAKYNGSNNQIFKIAPVNTTTAKASVTLTVPTIRQTDTRWKNVKFAGNCTIGSYGGLLCCVTALQSYKEGVTYRPDTYAKKLSFTSAGALQSKSCKGWTWGKAYSLSAVKAQLDSSNPVIVGGKAKTGGTAYAVVYAYSNGGAKASDFKVMDPSNACQTLQQLLNKCSSSAIYFNPAKNVLPSKTLNVKAIYQNDSKWKNYKYAKNATIGYSGCLLTCITMVMSYKDGKTYRPDTYSKNLSFNASGTLKWNVKGSKNWTYNKSYKTTNANTYAVIKAQLDKNNPVIVQANKAKNDGHYVVVYGYKNGGTAAKDFLIRDPIKNSGLTTLQQFFNKYPYNKACGLNWYNK